MKRVIQSLFAALAMVAMMPVFASCEKEELQPAEPADSAIVTLTATMEQPTDPTDTKTLIGPTSAGTTSVNWTSGDQIKIYSGTGYRTVSIFSTTSTGATGSFTIESGTLDAAPLIAYYPADRTSGVFNRSIGEITVRLPEPQIYVANSFGNGANPMVAYNASGTALDFKNVCGVLQLSLKGNGVKVNRIVLRSDELLRGTAYVKYNNGNPTIRVSANGGEKYVSLFCETPVTLNETTATDFYIVLPPTVSTSGFTVEIGTDQGVMTKVIPNKASNKIERNKITKMPPLETTSTNFTIVPYENHGTPMFINGIWWAPVNCGYDALHPYGLLYQWGRKSGQGYNDDDYKNESSPTIAGPIPYGGTPRDNTFYTGTYELYGQWMQNDGSNPAFDGTTLWTDLSQETYGDKVGDPCPAGWRVPTKIEIESIGYGYWVDEANPALSPGGLSGRWFGPNSNTATTANPKGCIFLPTAGYRSWIGDATAYDRGYHGYYWSSTPENFYAYVRDFYLRSDWDIDIFHTYRAFGYSVRCVKR